MNVLSFNLCIETDQNRTVRGAVPSGDDIEAMRQADAIILPQGCKESLYTAACSQCSHVFPNYDRRFRYPPGKIGQVALFEEMQVSFPQTVTYPSVSRFSLESLPFSFPFVFKLSWGGEGTNVFLIRSVKELSQCLQNAVYWEERKSNGFIVQEFIETDGRSLRVVVIDNTFFSYWRKVDDGGFYTNLAKGATVDYELLPDWQQSAVEMLKDFCSKTHINLAGFDFLFDVRQEKPLPLFLEINYCFRCQGLGGVDRYHKLLAQGVKGWLKKKLIKQQ